MTRCAIYARTSADDTERDSIGAQVDDCRGYAIQQGWTIVQVFTESEKGISGALDDRPGLNDALSLAATGAYDILLCRDTSRLARESYVAYKIRRQLKDLNVSLWTVKDGSAAGNKILDGVRVLLDDFVREDTIWRLHSGRVRAVREKGSVLTGGMTPYGYQLVVDAERNARRLVVDEVDGAIVRKIFDWYAGSVLEDNLTIAQVCRRLNVAGIPSPRHSPSGWTNGTVHRLLSADVYRGRWVYGKYRRGRNVGERRNPESSHIIVDVPAIVSDDLWNQVQERLATNSAAVAGNRHHHYLLNQRVICGECGHGMSGRDAGRYYRCNCVCVRSATCPCDNRTYYRVKDIDEVVWTALVDILLNPDRIILEQQQQAAALATRQEPIRRQLTTIERGLEREKGKLARLLDLYLDGQFDRSLLDAKRRTIETALETLQADYDLLVAELEAPALTPEQAVQLADVARKVAVGVIVTDYAGKKRMVDTLKVKATIWRGEGGEKMVRIVSRICPDGIVVSAYA